MSMSEFTINQKVIASSKCKLMKSQNDSDPLFCKIALTEEALIFINDEISKKGELLFQIPIYKIKDFTFINEKSQRGNPLITFFDTIFGVLSYAIDGLGLFSKKEKEPDLLGLSFVNEKGEVSDFILNMMTFGESGLIKEYKKLTQRG